MLLALDTATRQAGLALYDGEVVRAESLWSGGMHHTEWMAPAIEQALQRINGSAADLTALGVTIGPGSFTGLRVGLSLAKGIAQARGLPLIGISTLDATVYPHIGGAQPVLALLQAGRGRHAYSFYAREAEGGGYHVTEPAIEDINGLARVLAAYEHEGAIQVVGELTPAERAYLLEQGGERVRLTSPALALRRPAAVAELAWQRFAAGDVDDLHTLEPRYLHLPSSGRA